MPLPPITNISITPGVTTGPPGPPGPPGALPDGLVAMSTPSRLAVSAASPANVNLAATVNVIDGYTTAIGDRVLLYTQTAPAENGLYIKGADSKLTRSADADSSSKIVPGMTVLVLNGTLNARYGFVMTTTGTIVLGTTALTFIQTAQAHGSVTPGVATSLTHTVASIVAGSTDFRGSVTATTDGTGPGAGGVIITVTFAFPFAQAPLVTIDDDNVAAGTLDLSVAVTTTGFTITTNTPAISTAYTWNYGVTA